MKDAEYNELAPKRNANPRNPGQKLISTRERLNVSQVDHDWAGDVSAWPKKQRLRSVPSSFCPRCDATAYEPCGRGGRRCMRCGCTWGAD